MYGVWSVRSVTRSVDAPLGPALFGRSRPPPPPYTPLLPLRAPAAHWPFAAAAPLSAPFAILLSRRCAFAEHGCAQPVRVGPGRDPPSSSANLNSPFTALFSRRCTFAEHDWALSGRAGPSWSGPSWSGPGRPGAGRESN